MILRLKSGYRLDKKRPLYRVYASTAYKYKVARASLKRPKDNQKFWYPKAAFSHS